MALISTHYSDTNKYNLYHSLIAFDPYEEEWEFDEYDIDYIIRLIKQDLEIKDGS